MKAKNIELIKKLVKEYGISEDPETLKKFINLSSDSLDIIKQMNSYKLNLTMYFMQVIDAEKYNNAEFHKIINIINETENEATLVVLVDIFLKINLLKHPYYEDIINKLNELDSMTGFKVYVALLSLTKLWRDQFSLELIDNLKGVSELQEEILLKIFSSDVPYEYDGESYKMLINLAKKVKTENQKNIFMEILNSVGFRKEPRMAIKVLGLVIKTSDNEILENIICKYTEYYDEKEEQKNVYDELLDYIDPYREVKNISDFIDVALSVGETNYLFEKLSSFKDKEFFTRTRIEINSPFKNKKQ